MRIGIDPKIDYAFKRLFGLERNSDLLIDLVNAVLNRPLEHQITEVEILTPFNPKEFSDDKLSVLDIKARDQTGRLLNIEMQMLGIEHFPLRVLYYWAELFADQLREGKPYSDLQPTISICFLNDQLFRQTDDHHLTFHLLDEAHRIRFTEALEIHFIELPKFERRIDKLEGRLDQWLFFLRNAAELEIGPIPEQIDIPGIQKAAGELHMISQSDIEREQYKARQKFTRDAISREEEHRRQLHEASSRLEEAKAQSKVASTKGELVGRIHFCEENLGQSLTPSEDLFNLPQQELQKIADELKSKLLGRFANGE